ncbi:hypothetical protein [Sphingobium lactosutens]|uniref:Uncharacterized protein n=1 Tax=Sphingobium lactosutens DS20 TaxID=1331060 RepID=T0IQL6_9SPHN|nr:hypothetical protein [Sphingobium lactosutens]EQB11934.1 hypothetical protein RLDS_22675 [Sphingobium lactosutens DS20]
MTKKSYTPRWLDLRDEVAKSIGLLNGHVSDRQTINVLNSVTRTLMNKQALPERLRKTFIDNIRHRTRHTSFTYDGEIRLTDNQIKYARHKGRDQMISLPTPETISPAFQPEDEKDELLTAFQRHFIHISSHIQPDFTLLSSILGLRAVELLEFWWRNEMKSNEINHDRTMTFPSHDMRLAGSPDVHDFANDDREPAALPGHAMIAHEPAAAGFAQARTIIEKDGGDEEVTQEVATPVIALPRKKRRPEIAISYFHNDLAKAPSAMFEFGDEKFSLLFATADSAEERLRSVSNAEWIGWLEQSGGSEIREASRKASAAGHLSRYVMSPLYAAADKYGYKAPVVENCVVVLGWEADTPVKAMLVAGHEVYPIDLERCSYGEGRKPLFKGRAALPVQQDAAMAA